ncbi:GntR family transcriptional regulator [Acidisphaera rubrifaciens]|uniref:Transcriptional regulator GntR n=1 Tax=Acidisphaera rubrifaciens HS-AP3 TaxID=1231350 RepID=A0A0D6P7G1_9PROT|nr:GntR family transcriptional regulator [Acidisphaera rubrifaciens]GAN77133.1 transcriptional regulator GntR [Acidisphaera rubrifaciens HS-AP3]
MTGRQLPAAPLTERAYRALEEQIVTLALEPGAVVSEAMLAERLGLGRTPVREALQRLAREHLVQILPRRGIVVSEVNVGTQLRLLETRRELERLIARAAARRADARERARFAEIAAEMRLSADSNDETAFLRLDRAFNLLLMTAARNEFAEAAMQLMHGLARRFWYIHWRQSADLPLAARLHAEVAEAVAAGHPDIAAAASDRLMDYLEDFTRATLHAAA